MPEATDLLSALRRATGDASALWTFHAQLRDPATGAEASAQLKVRLAGKKL